MYFPLMRNKQEEILALRNLATLIQPGGKVLPIIEPVKPNGLNHLVKANIPFILIVNPSVPNSGAFIPGYVRANIINPIVNYPNLIIGYILTHGTAQEIQSVATQLSNHQLAFIHTRDFGNAAAINTAINGLNNCGYNIFRTDMLSAAYVNAFTQTPKINLRDYFIRQTSNINYPASDFFTDSHLTYTNDGFHGIGDFLTIGGPYTVGGGSAHAVAIHLTFNDPSRNNHIYVNHYVSTNAGGTANVQNKFHAANQLLVNSLNGPLAHINTQGTREFIAHLQSQHYPGLGVVKRFSMMHHIELMEGLV
jgi:hypothetical protein